MGNLFQELLDSSYLNGANATFIEEIYEQYLTDPASVSGKWKTFFDQLSNQFEDSPKDVAHGPIKKAFLQLARTKSLSGSHGAVSLAPEAAEKQAAVLRLINAYRVRGHQQANINPLSPGSSDDVPDLDPAFHGLTNEDMQRVFNTGSLVSPNRMTLEQIYSLVKETYCGSIGSEYMHITDTEQKRWVQRRLENCRAKPSFSVDQRKRILERLVAAEGIEKYLNTKYVGQKRFSLEGGDSLIPLLDELLQRAGTHGIKELVLGMAHRGRLNVLVNIMGKSPHDLFAEFEDNYDMSHKSSGDVKYHLGYSSDIETPGGELHLALAFNPSHLEIVNPVVVGSTRARQHRRGDYTGDQVLPVLLHGDAAFAGQGVVMETLQLSQARGFYVGGTVHIIINNQIGFTTSNPLDTRSTEYCTEVAKMVQTPIFHVNGEDPEAVVFITQLAMDFRKEFKKDVVIDLVCFRKHGHNETDEPAATQPLMYSIIKKKKTVASIYAARLVAAGVTEGTYELELQKQYRKSLDDGHLVAREILHGVKNNYTVDWAPYLGVDWQHDVETSVSAEDILRLQREMNDYPPGFELHSRVAKTMEDRLKMAAGGLAMDWGFAETMAYASLLDTGRKIRLCGQDSGRGTFAHRHAKLHNQKDGAVHIPLTKFTNVRNNFMVIDSLLSEEAVLGFEYGYATADPTSLVIWEAQFGDFVNGAQVVIDQFLSAGEAKWGRMCGLTMLLPHGYEGMGPEHSSARLERFLQLCAEHNIQVCTPTTPAQMFHMLRRQSIRPMRKPLIVMSPKSLLRHKLSTSTIDELTDGQFQNVIPEVDDIKAKNVDRVVICCGKVYFDLLESRRSEKVENVAIIRIEQLYPFPEEELRAILKKYKKAKDIIWCQEEPRNQGAWYQTQHHIVHCIKNTQKLSYAGRVASASPAVGIRRQHVMEQQKLVADAIFGEDRDN